MSKIIKIKRGLNARRIEVVPELGELVWVTDTKELWIGDGETLGGLKVTGATEELFIQKIQKGQPNGVATLDINGLIPGNQLPPLAISQTWIANDEAEQLGFPAEMGDVVVRTDQSRSWIHNGGLTGTMGDWTELLSPSGGSLAFTDLIDTPTNFTGQDGNYLVVDETNNQLIYTDTIDGGTYSG